MARSAPSLMAVQRYATTRNEQIELLIDYVMRMFAATIHRDGYASHLAVPGRQVPFVRDDCSDVFDHYLELNLTRSVGDSTGPLQIWGQVTTYKGGAAAEPNKTYEIRETLIETLGLRRWLQKEDTTFRTIHFTVGPVAYTYQWFKVAKDNAFDLSLYSVASVVPDELFAELNSRLRGARTEDEARVRLAETSKDPRSSVRKVALDFHDRLYSWFVSGMPKSAVADKQAALLDAVGRSQGPSLARALKEAGEAGEDIKGKTVMLLAGGKTDDKAMLRTLKRLAASNPFLVAAGDALSEWDAWSRRNFRVPAECTSIEDYIQALWTSPTAVRMVARRLLLRIHSDDDVMYVQDIGVPGVTEHTLYIGDPTKTQLRAIVERVTRSHRSSGITKPAQLYARLTSMRARQLLQASRKLEVVNGTNLKPSFLYVEETLSDKYLFATDFTQAGLPVPVAYHSRFGGTKAKVDAYTNMKLVIRKSDGRAVAIIKAKFFRKPEFPRRVKEEAYVGLTTKFDYRGSKFVERYPGIPLIMFVDMPEDLVPPEYAVRRLVTAGWEAFFSLKKLREYLGKLPVVTTDAYRKGPGLGI